MSFRKSAKELSRYFSGEFFLRHGARRCLNALDAKSNGPGPAFVRSAFVVRRTIAGSQSNTRVEVGHEQGTCKDREEFLTILPPTIFSLSLCTSLRSSAC